MTRTTLRERYATYFFRAAAGTAHEHAREATKWMKENARWRDTQKTDPKWMQDRSRHARRTLVAEVYGVSEQKKVEATIKAMDAKQNADTLKWLNASRQAKGQIGLKRLPTDYQTSTPSPFKKEPVVTIVFRYGEKVHYGIWLEIAHQGRFAIIAPAVDYWGLKFMRGLQILVNRGLIEKGATISKRQQYISQEIAQEIAQPGRRYEPKFRR